VIGEARDRLLFHYHCRYPSRRHSSSSLVLSRVRGGLTDGMMADRVAGSRGGWGWGEEGGVEEEDEGGEGLTGCGAARNLQVQTRRSSFVGRSSRAKAFPIFLMTKGYAVAG
jgi:hypothetical protein